MKRNWQKKRRGGIAALVAVSLVTMLGVVAIAVEGGLLLDSKRSVQAATDAAAYAASVDLFNNYYTNNGLDPKGTAKASALAYAAANGYSNDGVTSIVTVNIPPASGIATGKAGYVEIIIQYNKTRGFSSIIGSGTMNITTRAVARGTPGNVGILLLDPELTVEGQLVGTINILNGGQIYANSNSSVENSEFASYGDVGGVYLESTANVTCGGINIVGFLTKESGSVLTYTNGGGLKTGIGPWSDPLANVPQPTPSGTNYGSVTCSGAKVLLPGQYTTITIDSGATVVMNAGIYYLSGSGSGIQMNGGTLTGSGVMIYNQSGDNLNFNSATSVYLTPPTSGTYQGISVFQPRSDSREVHIESYGPVTITGTLYAQSGEFDLRPDGATNVFTFGNYICDQAEWEQGYGAASSSGTGSGSGSASSSGLGSSNGTIYMNPSTAAPAWRPQLVE